MNSKISLRKEIIVIDDGSTDDSKKIVKTFTKKHSCVKYYYKKNGGKGSAIREGLKYATGDIILIQDADLEYDPNDYQSLINPIIKGKTKVVYGSRRLHSTNSKYHNQPSGITYYIGGVGLTVITNLLYGTKISDEPTCYKVFRSDVIKNIPLVCTSFEFCPEVTAKIAKRRIPIYEVPIRYYPRSIKEGKKIKWKDGLYAVWILIKYKFKD